MPEVQGNRQAVSGVRILLTSGTKVPRLLRGRCGVRVSAIVFEGKFIRALEILGGEAYFDYFHGGESIGARFPGTMGLETILGTGDAFLTQNLRSGRARKWNLNRCPDCFAFADVVRCRGIRHPRGRLVRVTLACNARHRRAVEVPLWSFSNWFTYGKRGSDFLDM